MAPKIKFTKDEVIEAAMAVVEEKGLSSLTARSVALRLGSSTAPVYQQFATMEALALEVIKRTERALLDYAAQPYTDRVFLNMGTGVALYALEHGRLYKALMLEGDNYSDVVREFFEVLESELTRDRRFVSLSASDRHVLLKKMWMFTHGLASLISVGLIKDCNLQYIIDTLMDAGTDIIGATLAKAGAASSDKHRGMKNDETH